MGNLWVIQGKTFCFWTQDWALFEMENSWAMVLICALTTCSDSFYGTEIGNRLKMKDYCMLNV